MQTTSGSVLIATALLLLTIAAPFAQSAASAISAELDKLPNHLNQSLIDGLPPGVLPAGFNASALPSKDDFVKVLKQKCEKNAGNTEEWGRVEEAGAEFHTCIADLVDFEKLQEEIDAAQPNGELDTVFNKYCRKRTIAIECMHNLTTSIEPCLDQQEREHKQTFVNIFTNLMNFVCHKDGDQIALFIAEKGPECINGKKDALSHCFNQTFSGYAVPNVTLDALPLLIVGAKECNDMSLLQQCVVRELEHCEETTPANLVDAMFKFIRNETPCVNMTPPSRQTSSSPSAANSLVLASTRIALTLGAVGLLGSWLHSAKFTVL